MKSQMHKLSWICFFRKKPRPNRKFHWGCDHRLLLWRPTLCQNQIQDRIKTWKGSPGKKKEQKRESVWKNEGQIWIRIVQWGFVGQIRWNIFRYQSWTTRLFWMYLWLWFRGWGWSKIQSTVHTVWNLPACRMCQVSHFNHIFHKKWYITSKIKWE